MTRPFNELAHKFSEAWIRATKGRFADMPVEGDLTPDFQLPDQHERPPAGRARSDEFSGIILGSGEGRRSVMARTTGIKQDRLSREVARLCSSFAKAMLGSLHDADDDRSFAR